MPQNLTGLSAVIKEYYTDEDIESLFYKKCKLLGLMKKDTDAEGDPVVVPVTYGPGGGRSHVFGNAQSGSSGADHGRFAFTPQEDYAVFSITTKAMRATKSNRGAFVRGLKSEIDAKMYALQKSMGQNAYGDGSGRKGQILSGQGTATLTMTTDTNMFNFEVGETLVAGASSDGSDATANTTVITAVNRTARTITAAAAFHADFDDGDYVFTQGDAANCPGGLDAFLDGAATTLYTLDRSVDPRRLSGYNLVATVADHQTIEGALVAAAADISAEGGQSSDVFMNPLDVATFKRDISDKTTFEKYATSASGEPHATVSYKALQLATDDGVCAVHSDPHCPRGFAYLLDMETWCAYSYGALPGWLDDDGEGQILRESSADAVEGRLGCYWQMCTTAPGWNARINISAVN